MPPFDFHPAPAREGERQIVVPAGLETKTALFAFLREALPLPDYFGDNWDALDECLGEVAQGDSGEIRLLHQDLPLAGLPSEQRLYLQILKDALRQDSFLRASFPEALQPTVIGLLGE